MPTIKFLDNDGTVRDAVGTRGTVEAFAALLQQHQSARLKADGMTYEGIERNYKVKVCPAKKYTRVDVGSSGMYMVVNATGEIFSIKSYGVIHRGHAYGTLDTINDWNWGGYRAVQKKF